MEQPTLRILIAEDQLLIALEAERIIQSARACVVSWCRRADLATALSAAPYDIVILEADRNLNDIHRQVATIKDAGADLVVLCPTMEKMDGYIEFDPAAVVEKPFDEAQLTGFLRSYEQKKPATA